MPVRRPYSPYKDVKSDPDAIPEITITTRNALTVKIEYRVTDVR